MNAQKLRFLPFDLTFWLYHCVCLTLLVLSHIILAAFFERDFFVFNFLGFVLWLPLFTLSVLVYRFQYRLRQWNQLPMSRLIPLSFAFAFFASFLVTSLILLSMAPLFFSNHFVIDAFYNSSLPFAEFAFRLISISTVQSMVFMSAWIFIYVSVTSSRKIEEAEFANLRLENSLKEAKLSSLANQLNPHLLFNTLNNIRFMIHEDPKRAENMITDLSDILRYSLTGSQRQKVTLADEWLIVQRYLDIMNVQFDGRITFDAQIEDKVHAAKVPPLCMQMLVENAIKHGLDHVKGGELTLRAYERDGSVLFSILNTLPEKPSRFTSGTGTGLNNIRQRLAILYGDRASLKAGPQSGHFEVQLVLPFESTGPH